MDGGRKRTTASMDLPSDTAPVTSMTTSPIDRDADALYHTLTKEVIPCYYDRDSDGLPKAWIKRMMH